MDFPRLVAAGSIFFVSLVFSCDTLAPSARRGAANTEGLLYGSVLAADTNQPIPGASIHVIRLQDDAREQEEFTIGIGPEGHFAIPNAQGGTYIVFGEAVGFIKTFYNSASHDNTPTVIRLGPDAAIGLTLSLVPGGSITGTIADSDGQAAPGVPLYAWKVNRSLGRTELVPASTPTASTDKGAYALTCLEAGIYYIAAQPNAPSPDVAGSQSTALSFVTTYYPDSLSPDDAIPIIVRPGEQTSHIAIKIKRASAHHIQGKAVFYTPMVAFVRLSTVSNIPTATLTPLIPLSEDEAFDIPNVAPGRYSVELLDSTGDATLDSRIVEVNASDLTDVLLEQRAPVTLTGHVSLEHQNTPNGLRLLLVPADRRLSARPPAIGYIKKDGTFAISNVQPDTYFARLLGAPDGLYIKELILGRQKSDNDKINVSGNETLDVILDRATNDIEGTIDSSVRKDDSGTENLSVVAIADSQDPDPSTIWVSPVDSSGTFHLRNVRPGVIRLFAAPKSTPMDAWLTSQFLALMADKQTSVTVPQFGSARTTLPAIITNNELQEACLQLGVDIR